jgi:hypothetical protein
LRPSFSGRSTLRVAATAAKQSHYPLPTKDT